MEKEDGGVGGVRGKKCAEMGRERWEGQRREGGQEGPRPRTPRERRKGRGGEGLVEKRKERRLRTMVGSSQTAGVSTRRMGDCELTMPRNSLRSQLR